MGIFSLSHYRISVRDITLVYKSYIFHILSKHISIVIIVLKVQTRMQFQLKFRNMLSSNDDETQILQLFAALF